MKKHFVLLSLCILMLAACSNKSPATEEDPINQEINNQTEQPDTTSSPQTSADSIPSTSPAESNPADSFESEEAYLKYSLSQLGNQQLWLFNDMEVSNTIEVIGNLSDPDSGEYMRILNLGDDDNWHTLTVPELRINSPGFIIKNGELKGNVYVAAPEFKLENAKITGDLVFSSNILKDQSNIDASMVSGTITVS